MVISDMLIGLGRDVLKILNCILGFRGIMEYNIAVDDCIRYYLKAL